MKILLVSQEYPPETGWGGIGTYTAMLAEGLSAIGNEVHVLSVAAGVPRSDALDGKVSIHRRELFHPPGIGRLTGMIRTYEFTTLSFSVWRAFKELHAEIGFDVVEFPNWKCEGYFFLRQKPIPSAMRLHSMAFQLLPLMGVTARDLKWALRMEEWTVRRVDAVHAPPQHLKMVAGRFDLPAEQLIEVPAPLRVPNMEPMTPSGARRILFCGRFETRKNPEAVIRAAPLVLAEFPDTQFVFVGRDGASGGHDSYLSWMLDLARDLGVEDSIEIVDGWQPDGVQVEMPKAFAVVVPSRSESFGYVAAEGSSFGRPVVASNVSGLNQIVDEGKTGYLAAPEDPAEWSRALIKLLSDPDQAAQMGRRGREFVEQNLSIEIIAGRIQDAYRHAIERHRLTR